VSVKTRPRTPSCTASGQCPRGVANCGSTMRQEDRETLMAFEEGVAAIPQVLQAERLFGEPDYLLRIVTSDLAAYQRLQDDKLAVLPGVQRMTSTLVMKRIVHDRPLPA